MCPGSRPVSRGLPEQVIDGWYSFGYRPEKARVKQTWVFFGVQFSTPDHTETLAEGDLSQRDDLVRFRRGRRDLAVATVERDDDCLRARQQWRN